MLTKYSNLKAFTSRSFDPRNSGKISEEQFRKIMKSKDTIEEEDVNDMIQGMNGNISWFQ